MKLLESYLAPADVAIGETEVRKGTWLLAVHVLADELWEQVKDGELSGFSIGGSARRVPEKAGDRRPEAGGEAPEGGVVDAGNEGTSGRGERRQGRFFSLRSPTSSLDNRLHDIVVEEVSLVDRAANKHRFLIVKRSNDMDDETTSVDDAGEDVNATGETSEEGASGADDTGGDDQDNAASSTLTVAVEALEALTDAVERLSFLEGEATEAQLETLTSELARVSERLATAARPKDGEPSQGSTPDAGETPPESEPKPRGVVAETIASVRAALQRFNELVNDKPGDGGQGDDDDPTEGVESFFPLPKLPKLMAQLETLVGTMQEQQKRLARLEKRAGLPNSAPSGERRPPRPEDEEVSWPMDLNRGLDRESVDKALSFHDV